MNYYLALSLFCVYFLVLMLVVIYIGLSWAKINFKYKLAPQYILMVVYVLNSFMLMFAFQASFLWQMLLNVLMLCCVYIGN